VSKVKTATAGLITRIERISRERQTSHRYNAVKRGYIVMEDCTEQGGERYNIYYDNNTQRTPLFERNLKADGFRVREWNKPTNYTK
jgi:hypothetical protein